MSRPVAVVTGASRGIGRATALRLAERYDIVGVARSASELATLRAEVAGRGTRCETRALDLRDPSAIAAALAGIDADVLVNNAGVGVMKPLLEMSAEEWQRQVDVNLTALFHVTKALLPGMVAHGSGDIVNVGSIAGRSAFAGGTCYTATKAGVMAFTESLMLEVRDKGVRVSVVMPGSVDTSFSGGSRDASWKVAPAEVADAVWYMLTQPRDVLVHRLEIRAANPRK